MNTFDGTFGHFSNFVHVGKDLDLVRTRHTKRFNSYLAAVQQPGASIRPYLTTSASSILFSRTAEVVLWARIFTAGVWKMRYLRWYLGGRK